VPSIDKDTDSVASLYQKCLFMCLERDPARFAQRPGLGGAGDGILKLVGEALGRLSTRNRMSRRIICSSHRAEGSRLTSSQWMTPRERSSAICSSV
jgi:hypothetical protein